MEAMAKVVTELAAQHEKTMSTMMDTAPDDAAHDEAHANGMKEGSEDAMECPMMKEMEGHGEHQSNP